MESLKQAVQSYAAANAKLDGSSSAPVPGLMLKYVETPGVSVRTISRPLVCLVLQGAKRIVVGREERVISAGQSFIISADMPMLSRIIQASSREPYVAMAVELEISVMRELAVHMDGAPPRPTSRMDTLFVADAEAAFVDCALRLTRLIDSPEVMPLLRPGISQELHYWLLSGQHGAALRSLADPTSHAGRLGAAIAILRTDYRSRISIERLAAEAGMSLSTFHRHFKHMTSVTPGQYQKRLRLIEARRLMLEDGCSASNAAFDVGYESVSQFNREYRRLFLVPPKRDALQHSANHGGAVDADNRDLPALVA